MPFPLDRQHITATEQQLGASLPASYIASMIKSNGGTVKAGGDEWQLHPILDRSDRKHLARTSNDVLRETAACRQWEEFPDNAIAIAANGSGDQLVFLQHGDSIGNEVYIWDHETRALTLVATDFSALHDG